MKCDAYSLLVDEYIRNAKRVLKEGTKIKKMINGLSEK